MKLSGKCQPERNLIARAQTSHCTARDPLAARPWRQAGKSATAALVGAVEVQQILLFFNNLQTKSELTEVGALL